MTFLRYRRNVGQPTSMREQPSFSFRRILRNLLSHKHEGSTCCPWIQGSCCGSRSRSTFVRILTRVLTVEQWLYRTVAVLPLYGLTLLPWIQEHGGFNLCRILRTLTDQPCCCGDPDPVRHTGLSWTEWEPRAGS